MTARRASIRQRILQVARHRSADYSYYFEFEHLPELAVERREAVVPQFSRELFGSFELPVNSHPLEHLPRAFLDLSCSAKTRSIFSRELYGGERSKLSFPS